MVLGSDVPLEKDIFKKPPAEFVKTWSEWVAQNRTQIMREISTGVTSETTVYTVPIGITFFLTAIHGNLVINTTGDNAEIDFQVRDATGNLIVKMLELQLPNTKGATVSNSNTFVMPLKFEEGTRFIIDFDEGTGSARGFMFMVGWEEPKRIN